MNSDTRSTPGPSTGLVLGAAAPHLALTAVGGVVLVLSLDYGWFDPTGVAPGFFAGIAAIVLTVSVHGGGRSWRAGRTPLGGRRRP